MNWKIYDVKERSGLVADTNISFQSWQQYTAHVFSGRVFALNCLRDIDLPSQLITDVESSTGTTYEVSLWLLTVGERVSTTTKENAEMMT